MLLTTRTMLLNIASMPKTLPGLSNFTVCGQWVEPDLFIC